MLKRDTVSQREKTDVLNDVLLPLEKEDHSHQERYVIVPGYNGG